MNALPAGVSTGRELLQHYSKIRMRLRPPPPPPPPPSEEGMVELLIRPIEQIKTEVGALQAQINDLRRAHEDDLQRLQDEISNAMDVAHKDRVRLQEQIKLLIQAKRREKMLGDEPPDDDDITPIPRIREILATVAKYSSVPAGDLLSMRRTAAVVRWRQIAMYLAKTLTLRSLPEIGRRLGGRDHTTVLHAVRKMTTQMRFDPELAHDIAALEVIIMGRRT